MDDVSIDVVVGGILQRCSDLVELVAGPLTLQPFIEYAIGQLVGILLEDVPRHRVERIRVAPKEYGELGLLVLGRQLKVPVELVQRVQDEGASQREALQQSLLAAADELQDEQVVQQSPGLLDDHFADGPVVVALVVGFADDQLRHVDRLARAPGVEPLVLAGVMEDQQLVPFYHGDADPPPQQRLDQVIRQLPHRSVEELDQLMPGVKARELIILHQPAIPQPVLLAEDHRLLVAAQRTVDLGMGDTSLAQAAVGSIITGAGGLQLVVGFRGKLRVCRHG
jgi:hypothetical protein